MKKTTQYVAASTVIVVTMIGSSLVSAKVIRAGDFTLNGSVEIETIAEIGLDETKSKFNNGSLIRSKLRNIREKVDNSELLDVLNLTPSEFKELRNSGKNLKEIAEEKKIDVTEVKAIIEKQMIEKWERLLSNEIIDQEKFDELMADKDNIIEKHLNAEGGRLMEKMKRNKLF